MLIPMTEKLTEQAAFDGLMSEQPVLEGIAGKPKRITLSVQYDDQCQMKGFVIYVEAVSRQRSIKLGGLVKLARLRQMLDVPVNMCDAAAAFEVHEVQRMLGNAATRFAVAYDVPFNIETVLG